MWKGPSGPLLLNCRSGRGKPRYSTGLDRLTSIPVEGSRTDSATGAALAGGKPATCEGYLTMMMYPGVDLCPTQKRPSGGQRVRCSFNGMVSLAAATNECGVREVVQVDRAGLPEGFNALMEELAYHQPVLLRETVERLGVRPEGVYVDATVGEGGHASAVLVASAPSGVVLGVDRDPRSLSRAETRLREYGGRFIGIQGNYADAVSLVGSQGFDRVDGFLLDLGFSSRQVDAEGYGMSFQRDEPLDMRYDTDHQTLTAADIVNQHSEQDLARVIAEYGEEPRARGLARAIVRARPITHTAELAAVVARTAPPRRVRRVHPATRVFQALRIAVNDELAHLSRGLEAAESLLAAGGRLVVISYHSLEDRLVKNRLARQAARCICPPELPVCQCDHEPTLRLINRRIIRPSAAETGANPRSRSARMRVAERI